MKKMSQPWLRLSAFLVAFTLCAGLPGLPKAHASQVDVLIEKLVEKRILTRIDAETIRAEVETAEKKDFKAQVKSSTPWLEGLTAKGDVRLRYEGFERENEDSSDRNRYRFRVRWGLEKKLNDEWKAGFRLATGTGTNEATSTNVTFDGEFGLKQIFIDQAYGIYTPTARVKEWMPAVDKVEIGAGKVANPYNDKWATTIIWDGDVTPEGIYQAIDFKIADVGEEGSWKWHNLLGQFVVDEDSNLSPGDVEMLAFGTGTTYSWKKGHDVSFKFTYYDWQDYIQFQKTNPSSLASSFGGNDREVDDFKVLNFYADANFEVPTWWGRQNLKLFGDYAHNAGLQEGGSTDEELRNPDLRGDSDDAFSLGATLGAAKEQGEWTLTYEYLYIEPNAVVGNFAESDLGVGYANNQGHRLSWKYMILKNLEFNATAWLVERIDKTILTYGSADLRPNGDDDQLLRTQVDFVYKF